MVLLLSIGLSPNNSTERSRLNRLYQEKKTQLQDDLQQQESRSALIRILNEFQFLESDKTSSRCFRLQVDTLLSIYITGIGAR